jgi:hypothetical protein
VAILTPEPKRLLLDTQVFILGYSRRDQNSVQVLNVLRERREAFVLLLSSELVDQIRRVSRRVGGTNWTGLVLGLLWQEFSVELVTLPDDPIESVKQLGFQLPTEDIAVFLTAWLGNADILVSENREFVRQTAAAQSLFSCLNATEFLSYYGTL